MLKVIAEFSLGDDPDFQALFAGTTHPLDVVDVALALTVGYIRILMNALNLTPNLATARLAATVWAIR